ncbi:MAG: hypothetical protein U0V56_13565, partial [Actinomycetota bacterium]
MDGHPRRRLVLAVVFLVGGCTSAPDTAEVLAISGHAPSLAAVVEPSSEGEVLDRIAEDEVVNGWPTTTKNHSGVYSWDVIGVAAHPEAECGPSRRFSCIAGSWGGYMHNGYGSSDVKIYLRVLSAGSVPGEGAVIAVAGHEGIYRRIDARRERWIVDIAGTTISVRLKAEPDASRVSLDDAH